MKLTPREHIELLRDVAGSPRAIMALGRIRDARNEPTRPGFKLVRITEMRIKR